MLTLVLAVHALFIVYVVTGAWLGLLHRYWLLPHALACLWGVWIESTGRVCPLTVVEQQLRTRSGWPGYQGGFVEHYLTAAIYPDGLTRTGQIAIALALLCWTAAVYFVVFTRLAAKRGAKARVAYEGH